MKSYTELFKKHSLTGIVGSISSGKTNLLFNLINETLDKGFKPACYFYHNEYKEHYKEQVEFVNNLEELEELRNKVIFIDEFAELLELNNRSLNHMQTLERVFAQLEQNNNKIVLCGVPRYYNGFISGLVTNWVLCRLKFSEMVGGSPLKKFVLSLSGDFIGGTSINLLTGEFLHNGLKFSSEYLEDMDKKKDYKKVFEGL